MRKQFPKSDFAVGERVELRELKDRLVKENGKSSLYGTSNVAFEGEASPLTSEVSTFG